MTTANLSLEQEIDKLFESDWKDFYQDEKVRAHYKDLEALATTYYAARINGSKDSAALLEKLQILKKDFDAAVDGARAARGESSGDAQRHRLDSLGNLVADATGAARLAKFEALHSENRAAKAQKLAKAGLLATLLATLVLGGLGAFLWLETSNAIETAIQGHMNGSFKTSLKNEIAREVQESMSSGENPAFQVLNEKNAELEMKLTNVEGQVGKISELEIRTNQLQAELDKNASLRAKLAELESAISRPRAEKSTKASKTSKKASGKKTKR